MEDAAPRDDVLKLWLDALIAHPADSISIHSLQNEVLEKLKNGELPVKRAINQTLAAATRCQSRASEAHLRVLLVEATTAVDGFAPAFAGVFAARASAFAQSFATARLVVLRLSCAVVEAVAKDAPSWLGDVAKTQSLLLEAMLKDAERVQAIAHKALLRVLRKYSALVPLYVSALTDAAPEKQQYALWLVLCHLNVDAAVQEKAWKAYVFWAFEAKTRTVVTLKKNDLRFKGLTMEQFDTLIKPTVSKVLKKSPDSALEAVIELVRAVPLDLGVYLAEMFNTTILAKLKSTKEEVRAFTVTLSKELLYSFQTAEHFTTLVTQIAGMVEGKNGLLAQFYMREAAFAVLADAGDAIVNLGSPADAKSIAQIAIPSLVKALDKEAHDQTRHLGLLALGKWLAHSNEIAKDVLAKVQTGLKNKSEAVVAGYLRAVAVFALQSKSGISSAASLASELTRIIAEANKKPMIVHLDGILALGIAGALALSSSELDQTFSKDGTATVLLDSSSFVLPSIKSLLNTLAVASDNGNVSGRTKPEVTALVSLTQALTWVLSSEQADASAAYRGLVELLTSPVLPVRKAAEATINGIYASSLEHADGLLVALQAKLTATAELLEKEQAQSLSRKPSMVADDAASTQVAVVPAAGVLRRALRVIVPTQIRDADAVRETIFARALVLAHHPFVVEGRSPAAFGAEWNTIKQHFLPVVPQPESAEDADEVTETTDDRIDNLIEAHDTIKSSIVSLLTSVESGLLYSALRVERLGAQRALATLLNFAGNGEGESIALHDVIEDALMKRLETAEIAKVTEEDAAVFETPFDELYVPKKASAETEAKSRRTGSARRGNEDEQWEQQVREELEKKKAKNAAAAGKKLTAEEKAQLAQQQARRVELRESLTVVDRVLESINFLTSVRPDEVHPALPRLLRSLMALFQNRIFEKEANEALDALAKAISPVLLREHASDVASCMRVVLRLDQQEESLSEKAKHQKLSEVNELFVRTLASLMDFTFGFQFDTEEDYDSTAPFNRIAPPTLHLVFPVLRTLLHHDPELRRWALPLFAAHANMIPEEEEEEVGDVASQRMLRKDMLELVLYLLARTAAGDIVPISNPDLVPSLLLANLCEGPSLSIGEWAPVLGDGGLLSESTDVRHACLKALEHVAETGESELRTSSNPLLASRLFFACFDSVEANKSIAKHVWELTESELTKLFAAPLLVLLNHKHANVREGASLAIADGMIQFPDTITPILNNLKAQFQSHLPKAVEDIDAFGNPTLRRPGQADPLEEPETYVPRCGVSLCFEKVASSRAPLTKVNVEDVVSFVIEHGLVDPNSTVRAQMRKTGIQVIDTYGGGSNTSSLLAIFEQALDKKPKEQKGVDNHKAIERYDHQREGIVVCLGALAKHMDKTDPKVSSIIDSLVDALNIPSESVQRSVATCLAPLIPAVKDRSSQLLTDLLTRATSAETFGERIGAAFGVSAVVKGLGISALKQHDIIPRVEDMMKSGGANGRQGAMLVFECLSERLGLLFEPYIIVILPIMLKCFADASPQVREAASQTSKKIMANLSAHGVKLVLPSLLRSLDDGAWRTKQAGIQLLGSMAYCAPRQLGSCLPLVVPKITAALTDSHPKVRESSKGALRDIGSVVRNPEIASISNALLNALEDPNKHTNEALQQLQSTSFQHSIDAPSLALVMPIITRGLKDRAGDAKKKSALIVGQMCTMINDAKDLAPYMDMVLPSLKTQLMDPIPEVRAVSSKAMGKLVKGLGESHFSDILTWLLEAIKGDYGSVERSGAAQGLCEVLVALGKDRVESTLFNEIFPLSRHPKYSVREGVLWIIAFLPPALGKGFAVFISDALPIIVSGLSDEADSVRDVAMHAGHVVVNAHALSHTRDILPSLEAGLFDDSWRIRQSSVTLLGDLMYRISGTRAVGLSEVSGDNDNDDAAGSAAGDKAIIKTLGMERRNAILSSLYMIRSDTSAVVRQSSLQVWKSVVANTPKTLRQILPTLMGVIVSALSGDHVEKQTMAGRTLGEIVRKLGENVLPEIVPILRDGLAKENSAGQRQGACVGLAEVIECCNKKQLEDFVSTLVDAVLDGLCDELPLVRASAAQAFDVLQRNIGYRAIDETVPALLHRIKSSHVESQERALNGLQEILRVKSKEVLPYLMPRLLTTPVSVAAVRAITRVAQATGPVIHFHLEKILLTFVPQYIEFLDSHPSLAEDIKLSLRDVVLAVEDAGVHWLAVEICKFCESDTVAERALAFYLIAEFCGHTTTTYTDQAPLFLRQIVTHLNDSEEQVVKASSDALKGMNATIRPEEFTKHVDFIRQGINSLVSDARHRKGGVGATGEFLLPGLCIPKGLEPFLPSYQYALMNGSPELRQSAAAGLGELVQLSSAAALRPYLIKLTGPLIRIAGDRFPGHVKAAILHTLEIILEKGGVALKPFLPQLQTTFVKALNDTASEVRHHGTSALSKLVALSPRIDPLVAELTEKVGTTTGGIREANLEALASIMLTVGDKISAGVRSGLEDALVELLESTDDEVRDRASKCLAHAVATDAESGAAHAVKYGLAGGKDLSSVAWARKQSAALFLELVLSKKPTWAGEIATPVAESLSVMGMDEHIAVRSTAIRAIATLVKHSAGEVGVDQFVPILAQGIAHPNKDVSKNAAKIAKRLAKRDPEAMRAHVATLVPPTFGLIKSNNIAVKMTAERALLYLLEVQTRPETLANYVRTDAANGKIISEYARRVLAKLKADSGDESE